MAGGSEDEPAEFSPPSPGVSPVGLSDCIEELVRFTLAVSLDEAAMESWDLGLSADYCSRLLEDGPLTVHPDLNGKDFPSPLSGFPSDAADSGRGVPTCPLYKRLARAMERCMVSGEFLRSLESMELIPGDESSKTRENYWTKLIVDTGTELSNMLEAVEVELHVQEPFFSQLRAGQKTVEGRCATCNYNRIAPGALLLFNKCLLLKVQNTKLYSSFTQMLQTEALAHVLPGVETIEEGLQIYRKFYTQEKEMSNGVLAISVSKPASQPYICMANLLSGLRYDGIGGLLGMMHTTGTIQDALPPPRSSLISSSMKPHRLDE